MIGRRKLIIGGAGGLLFGLSGIALTRNGASMRFIGARSSIIALLDTSTERVLFVLGEQDDALLENIPGLTTVGNTRTDLVVAAHQNLSTQTAREHLQTDRTNTLAIQAHASVPPIRGHVTTVTGATKLEFGGQAILELDVTPTQEGSPGFLATINIRDTRIVLASTPAALNLIVNRSCELLAVPGLASAVADVNVSPQLLVSNSPDPELSMDQLEVYPTDPTMVRIGDGSTSVRDDHLSPSS